MTKYDYYLHRSGGRVFDSFGGIGRPYRVSWLWFKFAVLIGYRGTRVQKGASLTRVYIRAALKTAHRHSIRLQYMKLGRWDEI